MIDKKSWKFPRTASFNWHELNFEFKSEISEDFMYLASYNTLYLNGKPFLRSGGFHFRESARRKFTDGSGIEHEVRFETSNLIDIWQPVTILIDNEIVYQGAAPIKGLLTAVLIYFPIGFLIGIALGKCLGILNINF